MSGRVEVVSGGADQKLKEDAAGHAASGALFADSHQHAFLPGKLPARLPAPLDVPGRIQTSRSELDAVRGEVNRLGTDPMAELPKIMHDVRVLGLGETHLSPNPQRDFGATVIGELKNAGATHLAVEMDEGKQAALDKFLKTGELDRKALPEKLQNQDYVNILEGARKAGLKITAVDNHFAENFLGITRDRAMAGYVKQILDEAPQNKVVFWVGSDHLSKRTSPGNSNDGLSSAQILASEYSTATVLADGRLKKHETTLGYITPDLTRPAMVRMADAPKLRDLRENADVNPKAYFRDYDYVIDFPVRGK